MITDDKPKFRTYGRDNYSITSANDAKRRLEQIPASLTACKKATVDRSLQRRISKAQHKFSKGILSVNDAIILSLDVMLDCKPARSSHAN